jgi:hypothetical protein
MPTKPNTRKTTRITEGKTRISGANAINLFELATKQNILNNEYPNFLKWWETPEIQNLEFGGIRNSYRDPPSEQVYNRYWKNQLESQNMGLGQNTNSDGLYNDQIEKILKKRLKHFVPCIAADKTHELMRYVGKKDKEFAFVINTNPSESDGTGNDGYPPGHWTCVYIDNRDDYPSCEYFDTFSTRKTT